MAAWLAGLIGIGLVIVARLYRLDLVIDEMAYRIFVLILFCLTLSPMAIAPLTAFLGQSMFSNQPRIRSALGMFFGALALYCFFIDPTFFTHGLFAWYARKIRSWCFFDGPYFSLIGSLFAKPHFTEVVLLERLNFKSGLEALCDRRTQPPWPANWHFGHWVY